MSEEKEIGKFPFEIEDEDTHIIMALGRLLAEISVILKGPEPAGTAWSYHDLPSMVRDLKEQNRSPDELLEAFDDACCDSARAAKDGRCVSWRGYMRKDRIEVIQDFLGRIGR